MAFDKMVPISLSKESGTKALDNDTSTTFIIRKVEGFQSINTVGLQSILHNFVSKSQNKLIFAVYTTSVK